MKLSLIYILLVCTLSAQQIIKISGKVTDFESGTPLHPASVLILHSSIGTQTDKSGDFILSHDFGQEDTLQFSFLGYEKLQIAFRDLPDGSNLVIKLKRGILISQSIYVTASVGEPDNNATVLSTLSKKEIQSSYSVQDVPEYLSSLPSVNFYSDNGASVGYNYLSIRGFDQRRISVSINGIPQNDPEDHNVYWINFSDILSSTDLIAVQRGSGGGAMGYPAIGGSVNLMTSTNSDSYFLRLQSGIGSFQTRKYSAEASSGLLGNQSSIYVKLSSILSSGYRENSFSRLNSYYLSYQRFYDRLVTQVNIYGGMIEDGLVYTGLPKFAVKDKELRRKNYSYWEADEKNFTYFTERRAGEIENFSQPHYEILNEYTVSEDIKLNSALFFVTGNGFYDYDASWAPLSYFRIGSQWGFNINVDPDTVYAPNALIRAMVENKQYGWIPRISIKHNSGEFIAGLELRKHNSLHWGSLRYGENIPSGVPQEWKYYSYKGSKDILNAFIYENYTLSDKLVLQGEFQAAYNKYRLFDEDFLNNDFSVENLFLNGRVGLLYKHSKEFNYYLTAASVTREPRLKEYYDAAESSGGELPQFALKQDGNYDWTSPLVKPEKMTAFDLGLTHRTASLNSRLNFYLMFFKDEIVKSGDLDRFGQPRTGNMKSTYHVGIELSTEVNLSSELSILGNISLSKNKINEGVRYISVADSAVQISLAGNDITGFPDILTYIAINYQLKNYFLQLSGRFVGGMYSDNYGNNLSSLRTRYQGIIDYSDNKNEGYFSANLFTSYDVSLSDSEYDFKFYLQINNLFDSYYSANAVGKEFFPAAERNVFAGVKLSL